MSERESQTAQSPYGAPAASEPASGEPMPSGPASGEAGGAPAAGEAGGAPAAGGPQHEPHPGATAYRQTRFRPPPGATGILLIRHGESQAAYMEKPFPLVNGHADPDLAENGHKQAERLAERLAKDHIDALYVTSLCRTAQTAAPLAQRLGLTPQVEPDLREVNLGEWEAGVFRKMVAENHPIAEQMWAQERWDVIPGAEAAEVFGARTSGALKRIAAAHPDQSVAVVTHGGVIAALLAWSSRPSAGSSAATTTPRTWSPSRLHDHGRYGVLLVRN